MKTKINNRNVGVNFSKNEAQITVWAPLANHVSIKINNNHLLQLQRDALGYWLLKTDKLKPADHYVFVLDDKELADPASLSQPDGVHGPSQAIDLSGFKWTDGDWKNPELADYIIYELHTGTFSSEGNFAGIESKLNYLRELGINAIEIMPVAQFPGTRNWGYDGVFPFAVQNSYGGAGELQSLINRCHEKGFAVVLDVVYNHFGPEGNYLPEFGPYFTEKYKTPWGNAINFDDTWCDGVRQYFIENALMWFRDFHIDALRMDAVHAIKDFSPKHILQEIRENVDELIELTGKPHHLTIECDLNDTRYINSLADNGYGMDAQWTDEFHHALRVTAGQPKNGYYADFKGIADLAKAYQDAYVYDGQFSEQRHKKFGVKTNNPGDQFIVFSQNHDQVGNRMLGERTSALVSFEMQKLMAAAVMLSSYLPMLFMGEEWSATSPFQYFVSHSDEELIKAVQKGRKEEFKEFHAEGEAPDPQAENTFDNSKLKWQEVEKDPHKTMLNYYKVLIALRKKESAINSTDRNNMSVEFKEESKTLFLRKWDIGQQVLCLMNFSDQKQQIILPADIKLWQKLLDSAEPKWNGPGSSPVLINANNDFTLMPESIVVYTQYYV